MHYCRHHGWLEFVPSTQGTLPSTASQPGATTSESAAQMPAADRTVARKLPKPASKATQVAATPLPEQGDASTGKQRAPAKQTASKRRKSGKFRV